MPYWVCCGAVPPLVTDDVLKLIAPVRNLASAREMGDSLVTSCVFCYNILKRSNKIMKYDREKRDKINNFTEENYKGELKVFHFIEVLRDRVGLEAIRSKVKVRLRGLTVAPYYGCLLLRPYEDIRLDDPEEPRIIEDLTEGIGCAVIDFPYKNECCGSYLSVSSREIAVERASIILNSSVKCGADIVVVACPLCHFNLDYYQAEIKDRSGGFLKIPVLYVTQILGVAFGLYGLGLDQHYVDPRPLLRKKRLIE